MHGDVHPGNFVRFWKFLWRLVDLENALGMFERKHPVFKKNCVGVPGFVNPRLFREPNPDGGPTPTTSEVVRSPLDDVWSFAACIRWFLSPMKPAQTLPPVQETPVCHVLAGFSNRVFEYARTMWSPSGVLNIIPPCIPVVLDSLLRISFMQLQGCPIGLAVPLSARSIHPPKFRKNDRGTGPNAPGIRSYRRLAPASRSSACPFPGTHRPPPRTHRLSFKEGRCDLKTLGHTACSWVTPSIHGAHRPFLVHTVHPWDTSSIPGAQRRPSLGRTVTVLSWDTSSPGGGTTFLFSGHTSFSVGSSSSLVSPSSRCPQVSLFASSLTASQSLPSPPRAGVPSPHRIACWCPTPLRAPSSFSHPRALRPSSPQVSCLAPSRSPRDECCLRRTLSLSARAPSLASPVVSVGTCRLVKCPPPGWSSLSPQYRVYSWSIPHLPSTLFSHVSSGPRPRPYSLGLPASFCIILPWSSYPGCECLYVILVCEDSAIYVGLARIVL